MDCWWQFGAILAREADDPELLAEHFLTVACYNLQHPAQFAPEVADQLRSVFVERLDHQLPIAEIRRRFRKLYDGHQRVLKRESERRPVLCRWKMTIADVYIPDHPEGAANRVRAWAAAIRSEL